MTDFWADTGILEIRENGQIVERILSRNQFKSLKDKLIKVNVTTPMSNICQPLTYIYIYEGSLNF